jgi:hypothetical protein
MRDYRIEMGLHFDEQRKLRRRAARDREVVRVPLDRGSRGRFALVQRGRQTSRRLGSSFMLSTRHQSHRRGREFAWLAHHQRWSRSGWPQSPRLRPNPSTHIPGARRLDFRPGSRRAAERRSRRRLPPTLTATQVAAEAAWDPTLAGDDPDDCEGSE